MICTLFLLDGGLWILSKFTNENYLNRKRNETCIKNIILCVGDSHTYGLGATDKMDYPSQLSARLNIGSSDGKWCVENRGIPGANSSIAVNTALQFFNENNQKPRVVIFCAGGNNLWNTQDARIFPEQIRNIPWLQQIKYLLANSRAWKFGKVTTFRMKQIVEKNIDGDHAPLAYPVFDFLDDELYMRKWVLADLNYLLNEVSKYDTNILLLTYWMDVPWVDEAYARIAIEYKGVYVVNVHNFGLRLPEELSNKLLSNPDAHPNDYGYAKIADAVYDTIDNNNLLH